VEKITNEKREEVNSVPIMFGYMGFLKRGSFTKNEITYIFGRSFFGPRSSLPW
jgi:hypothetical protein